jgi:hypothetical protein
VPVLCEKQGHKLRMHALVVAEISTEETADEIAIDRGIVSWEMYIVKRSEHAFQICSEFLYLGGFSGSVQTFEDN